MSVTKLPQKEIRVVWTCNTYGFMDFVRGYICVDQIFGQECKITPVIDPLHHLSKVFPWANSHLYDERRDIRSEEYFANQWQQHYFPQSQFQTLVEEAWLTDKEVLYADYANGPLYPIKSGYEWLLLPSEEYNVLAQEKAHGVIRGEYFCLHVRTGDSDYVHDVDRYVDTIKEMVKEYRQIVVVCDNQMLKNALPQDILQSPASPKHSKEMPKEGIVDWLVDLKLICGAKEIISICDFPWGSTGFSKLPAEIHGIPYRNIQPYRPHPLLHKC
ncbi:MAG: hypothetical protein FWG73_01265 [Planctomycetaceae bacterium]|nr:hypothetical protein [Planctomycetaceae bacterium]